MNITKEPVDNLNAVITVKVDENDYQEKVEDVLKDYRKKANIKGFRPGKVPMGMIRKMYYIPVLVEEINRMVSDKLMTYIHEEKLAILGEPMPHNGDQKEPDFTNDKEFEFKFDLGLAPDFKADVTEKDKITFYTIKVEDKVINDQIDNIAKRFGEFYPVEEAKGDELVVADLYELDEKNQRMDEGVYSEQASMSLDMMKDEKEKKAFKAKKVGDIVVFNVKVAYPNDAELSSLLKVEKEKLAELSSKFEAEIKEIKAFQKHEVNQELFDKVYGEGTVKSKEEFKEKISEELKMNYERESNYKFALDSKDYFIKKAKIDLPVEFLKRWIVATNEEMSEDKIDQEFASYEDEFRWQLIKDRMIRAYEINVSEQELLEYAFILSKNQFYQYGLYNVPDEQIENYAREQLTKPEESRRLRDQKYEDKLIKFIKESVKLEKKEITEEKFRKLFEK
jgi:trigger factor